MSSLRKKMRSDPRFNAFNDAFDFDLLACDLLAAADAGQHEHELSAAVVLPYFNRVYTGFYERVKALLARKLVSVEELEETVLSIYNRTYLYSKQLAEQLLQQQVEDTGFVFANSYQNVAIPGAIGPVYLGDGLENHVDSLNMLFSYLRHQPRLPVTQELDEQQVIRELYQLADLVSQAATYKSCYDDLVWQGRRTEQRGAALHLLAVDKEVEEIIQIGKTRIDQTISNATALAQTALLNSSTERTYWVSHFRKNRKPRHLQRVAVVEGYVVPATQAGFSDRHLVFDLAIHASIRTYYEYAESLPLPAAGNLRIRDVAILYAELMELIYEVENLPWTWENPDLFTFDDFYAMPFRLKLADLKGLLHLKTRYSTAQLNAFVDLLTHQGNGRVDFWSKPFVRRHDDLLFPLLPIAGSHILYLVDEWLKAGGYSLDARGPLFERYLRQQVQRDTLARGFFCRDHSGRIEVRSGQFEEVDLLLEFEHVILVAEVKCIGYPLEARDRFNAHRRVAQGAQQVNRKAKFLHAHRQALAATRPGLASKPLVKAVITNFPLFSGLVLEGVPVSDAVFLHHYVADGNSRQGFTSMNAQGYRDTTKSKTVTYYTNEYTFCQNLAHYLAHSIFVDSTREFCIWKTANTIADLFKDYAHVDFSAASSGLSRSPEAAAEDF